MLTFFAEFGIFGGGSGGGFGISFFLTILFLQNSTSQYVLSFFLLAGGSAILSCDSNAAASVGVSTSTLSTSVSVASALLDVFASAIAKKATPYHSLFIINNDRYYYQNEVSSA